MKVSSSKIISRDAAASARRWEPQRIDSTDPQSSVVMQTALAGEITQTGAEPSAGLLPADEVRRVREQAARDGFEQGLTEGRALGARDAAELRLLVAGLRDIAQALEQSLAERIVQLAVEIARVVVRKTVEVKPEFILDVIREAVVSLPDTELRTEVALHPDDARLLREALRGDPNAALPWHVVEDSNINRGGCTVSNRSSDIDATLESRWRRIVSSLGRDDRWLPSQRAAADDLKPDGG